MVFVVMTPYLEVWATFLDPPRSLATVHLDQTLDVPDPIAFRNDTRLGQHAWRERATRTGSLLSWCAYTRGTFLLQASVSVLAFAR